MWTPQVLSFAAFLRIDAATMVEMDKRKSGRRKQERAEEEEDEFDAAADALQYIDDIAEATSIAVQGAINKLPYGELLPIESLFILKADFGFWWSILNVMMSLAGSFVSPLCFSFHLLRIAQLPQLQIVISSVTTNWSRLATTCLLAVVAIYLFAIFGVLHFEYTEDGAGNEPCSNLLTCFTSYQYAGFAQSGLADFFNATTFPIEVGDLGRVGTVQLVFDVTFTLLVTTLLLAIITGIICDTFGEARRGRGEHTDPDTLRPDLAMLCLRV